MTSAGNRVPDWLLERLAASELPEKRAQDLRWALREAGEEERLASLARSNAELLATHPAALVVAEIERRAAAAAGRAARAKTRRARPIFALSLAAACTAGLAVFLAVHDHQGAIRPTFEDRTPESIGIKGLRPALRIHRKTKAGSELLRPGAQVRKGDTLQLGYVAAGRRFGVIASIDGRGTVTLHLPEAPGTAAALERDGERPLPHAFELDDSPGFERFIFFTSDSPFATAVVTQALKGGGNLPAALAAIELTLKKETP